MGLGWSLKGRLSETITIIRRSSAPSVRCRTVVRNLLFTAAKLGSLRYQFPCSSVAIFTDLNWGEPDFIPGVASNPHSSLPSNARLHFRQSELQSKTQPPRRNGRAANDERRNHGTTCHASSGTDKHVRRPAAARAHPRTASNFVSKRSSNLCADESMNRRLPENLFPEGGFVPNPDSEG